jgi:transcriptional regulator with GAF, ATPase, and Fis domain
LATREGDERSTVLHARPELACSDAPGLRVRVVEGPDEGKEFSFDGNRPVRLYVGHSRTCDIVLSDSRVSRRHVAIDLTERPRIVDLESTNGSHLDGVPFVEAFLRNGDTLRIGATTLLIDLLSSSSQPISTATAFGRVVGASPEMRRLFPICERLAVSDVSVLVEGETGTGKELLAESIHEASRRAAHPFVVFDCTAVPASLIESALFGHERGSFTGAVDTRVGVFEQAHRGTLLVDEIGELDLALQPKLLRVLQNGQVQRVGSNRWTPVDVRVIAATRRDLDHEIQTGRFRDDLYFRLAVARVELPPLRQRRGDIALLAATFWKTLGGAGAIPPELIQRLQEYPWPGNVRELYNVLARRAALGDLDLSSSGLAPASPPARPHTSVDFEAMHLLDMPLARAREQVVGAFERYYVERILDRHQGNVARAADASGIARRYFQLLRARQQGR